MALIFCSQIGDDVTEKKAKITDYLWKLCSFYALSVFILLCKYLFLENVKKKYSRGVCRVTVNTAFFSRKI